MIEMSTRVDDELDRFFAQLLDRVDHFVRKLSRACIDDDWRLIADLNRNVRAVADKHVQIALYRQDVDLTVVWIGIHGSRGSAFGRVCPKGATVITQSENKPYYEKIWALPHMLNPDRLAKASKKPITEAVEEKRVLTDGQRTLELYHLQGSNHSGTTLIGYLPKEKVLIEADVYTPGPANAPPVPASKETLNLNENIKRLQLDVQQIAPIHGRRVTIDELRETVGRN
jgi:hypothetical protein